MDSDVLVKVEGVSKKFCRDLKRSLWYGVKDISSEILGISPSGELRESLLNSIFKIINRRTLKLRCFFR